MQAAYPLCCYSNKGFDLPNLGKYGRFQKLIIYKFLIDLLEFASSIYSLSCKFWFEWVNPIVFLFGLWLASKFSAILALFCNLKALQEIYTCFLSYARFGCVRDPWQFSTNAYYYTEHAPKWLSPPLETSFLFLHFHLCDCTTSLLFAWGRSICNN